MGTPGEEAEGTCWEKFWFHFSTSVIDVFFWRMLKAAEVGICYCVGRKVFPHYTNGAWGWQLLAECALFAACQLIGWYIVSIRFCSLFYHDKVPLANGFYSRHVMAWFSANKIRKVFTPPIHVAGTRWAAVYMRMLGVKVGRRFFSPNEEVMVDPPFGRLGDDVTVDYDAQVRQHSFEDNMLKWGPNWIESGTSILQAGMVAKTDCGEGVTVMRGAVTWKGNVLESGSTYDGAPAFAAMSSAELYDKETAFVQNF